MDARYFRDKAAACLRLAHGLPVDHPGRHSLIDMAADFERRANELEAQRPAPQQQVTRPTD